jgi:hypothetical protein
MLAAKLSSDVAIPDKTVLEDVVEVALLLPADRLEALVALSRRRRQSVGQILRGLIDRALASSDDG